MPTLETERRRSLVSLGWLVSVGLAALVGFAAARATLIPQTAAETDPPPALYVVTEGTVEQLISFTAEANWTSTPLAPNGTDGTVTTLDVQPGATIDTGDRLYSVDLRPVFAAEGSIPAFRDIAAGDRGLDIAQLQRFLNTAGMYAGPDSETFDQATGAAVRAWQESVALPVDGVVRQGDIVFVPELPARVKPAEALRVGIRVRAGEPALDMLPATPTFTITLGPEQADLVPLNAEVIIERDASAWTGSIAKATNAPTGELVLTLGGIDGAALCGNDCASVPVDEPALYTADLVVVPTTSGPLLPVAALVSEPSGTVHVVSADGRQVPVTIEASSGGHAVVAGIEPGMVIRLFGDANDDGLLPAPS